MSVLRQTFWGPRQPEFGREIPTSNSETVLGQIELCAPFRRARAPTHVPPSGLPSCHKAGGHRRCAPCRQQKHAVELGAGIGSTARDPERSRTIPNAPRQHVPHLTLSPPIGYAASVAPPRYSAAAGHLAHHETRSHHHTGPSGAVPQQQRPVPRRTVSGTTRLGPDSFFPPSCGDSSPPFTLPPDHHTELGSKDLSTKPAPPRRPPLASRFAPQESVSGANDPERGPCPTSVPSETPPLGCAALIVAVCVRVPRCACHIERSPAASSAKGPGRQSAGAMFVASF
jgi:hypothetical protein